MFSAIMLHFATSAATESGTPRKQNFPNSGQKRSQTNVRVLRGHRSAITALHCVTKRDVWDVVSDREDTGFFISGSTDCTVSQLLVKFCFCKTSVLKDGIMLWFLVK